MDDVWKTEIHISEKKLITLDFLKKKDNKNQLPAFYTSCQCLLSFSGTYVFKLFVSAKIYGTYQTYFVNSRNVVIFRDRGRNFLFIR